MREPGPSEGTLKKPSDASVPCMMNSPGVIYCRALVKICLGCLSNSVEIHCTCHQLLLRSCYLFRDIPLVCIKGGTLRHADFQFLYTGSRPECSGKRL